MSPRWGCTQRFGKYTCSFKLILIPLKVATPHRFQPRVAPGATQIKAQWAFVDDGNSDFFTA